MARWVNAAEPSPRTRPNGTRAGAAHRLERVRRKCLQVVTGTDERASSLDGDEILLETRQSSERITGGLRESFANRHLPFLGRRLSASLGREKLCSVDRRLTGQRARYRLYSWCGIAILSRRF